MIRAFTAALPAALLLAPVTARAADAPPAIPVNDSKEAARIADERLVNRLYNDNEVVRISGRLGVQATIGFGEGEHIENVAVGDAESWQITPNKRADLLFVKPLSGNARTNMTVVTDRHTYFFDLVASPKAKPLYMLRFTYRDEPKPQANLAALSETERQAIDGDPVTAPADPATLNFSWRKKGDAALLPARIYDDGQATYLLWGAKQQVPAILVRNEKGEEGPVNYAVRGPTIVIDEVPGEIVLRMGRKSATLENLRDPQEAAAAATAPPATAPSAAAALAQAARSAAVANSDRSQPVTR